MELRLRPRRRRRLKLRQQIPNILIGVGIVFLLAFGIYEGANYPWKLLFSRWGLVELSAELPDPAPLPDSAHVVSDDPGVSSASSGQETLPVQSEWLAARPAMNITRLGVIKLPKIQISENIVEGSDNELFYGVGHVSGTAMPGELGNCVLAGHRNYIIMRPFRYLDKMEIRDLVYVTDDRFTYTYEVFNIFEVGPDDTWILLPQQEESHMLTLLTCTPVMNPVNRLVVRCKLISTD